VIGVSDRDSVFVADDANPWAVFRVASSVAATHRSAPYLISPSLYHWSQGRWEPLDPDPVDDTHPIPNLQVIDVHLARTGRGADLGRSGTDLGVVVASPLGADARSVARLFRKLHGYLEEINGARYQEEFGQTTVENTSIVVYVHPGSDPRVWQLLAGLTDWVKKRNATLQIEKIDPVE
jgi:hypothetical protein